jgi:hypothetical protein
MAGIPHDVDTSVGSSRHRRRCDVIVRGPEQEARVATVVVDGQQI